MVTSRGRTFVVSVLYNMLTSGRRPSWRRFVRWCVKEAEVRSCGRRFRRRLLLRGQDS